MYSRFGRIINDQDALGKKFSKCRTMLENPQESTMHETKLVSIQESGRFKDTTMKALSERDQRKLKRKSVDQEVTEYNPHFDEKSDQRKLKEESVALDVKSHHKRILPTLSYG
ncbi:uncharacterized protein G2W53_037200 [Senna tora]|uniref:Uncharacterized protein n=1 Tax=Senna tora TaxID=362788 RepID=A0A834W5V3_9FABA|nr:uncharacterized protein G2W53_037200 [Senna tora]